jgi:hypothetical protein
MRGVADADRPASVLTAVEEEKTIMPTAPLFAAFGPEATNFLSSAFEDAWKRLSASDSSLAGASAAAAARERLAKCVIEIGKRGVRNRELLIKNAIARFREIERGHHVGTTTNWRSGRATNAQSNSG